MTGSYLFDELEVERWGTVDYVPQWRVSADPVGTDRRYAYITIDANEEGLIRLRERAREAWIERIRDG